MNMYKPEINTPILNNNLKQLYGKKRVKWEKKIIFESYVILKEFDIEKTFLENISNLICAVAKLIPERKIELSIYRFDENDLIKEEKPINLDQYIIEEQLQKRADFFKMTKSTEFNDNMKNTISSNDLYIKLKEDNIIDHHTSDLPSEVKSVLNIYKPRYQRLVNEGKIKI